MPAIDWLIDPASGDVALAGPPSGEVLAILDGLLPLPRECDCARPLSTGRSILPSLAPTVTPPGDRPRIRVRDLGHGVLGCGPGRRSVVQFQGCRRQCPGCGAPETHDPRGGTEVSAPRLAELLLDPAGAPRDGVTVTGGEPFSQAAGLAALLQALRGRGSPHVLLYSGHTWEELALRGEREPDVSDCLALADWLVDGPFVRDLADPASPWAGSRNQRLIDLPASRARGQAVVLEWTLLEESDGHKG